MNETSEKPTTSWPRGKRHCRPFLWPLYRQIIGRSDRPILVGPWRGEVGFEALYWLPFLAKLRHDWQILPDRLIPITRGGAGIWYDTPQAIELYAMRTPQDVRVENRRQHARTGMLKQTHVTDWDRQVLRDAADTLKVGRCLTLHPAWLYQTLRPYWEAERGLGWLQDRLRFAPFPTLQIQGLELPERFVAVRFYFRATFPATELTRDFARATITRLAKETPVIVLNNPTYVDDHLDYVPTGIPNVSILSELVPLTVENNLAVQAAVLQRALGFVGTYGGLAQLALRIGLPTISVYDEWGGTALPHKHLSDALAIQMGRAGQVVRIGDLPMLQAALPAVLLSK